MRAISLPRFLFAAAPAALAAALAACNNPLALPAVQYDNVVDTVTVYALTGTSVTVPSGFDIASNKAVFPDRANGFDFAVDIDSGQARLYPTNVLGVSGSAGIYVSSVPFDSVHSAPTSNYVVDSTVAIAPGDVFVARSRPASTCSVIGSLPLYGKFRVLTVDPTARTVRFEALVNLNCGYRNLDPGTPSS